MLSVPADVLQEPVSSASTGGANIFTHMHTHTIIHTSLEGTQAVSMGYIPLLWYIAQYQYWQVACVLTLTLTFHNLIKPFPVHNRLFTKFQENTLQHFELLRSQPDKQSGKQG